MKSSFFALCVFLSSLFAEYSIVFIHIGDSVPEYADIAIEQARLFNKEARIILLSSKKGLERFETLKENLGLDLFCYEDIPRTLIHEKYSDLCIETSPFWRYTSERFLYLWDLMDAYSLGNVFHLENDNMLYADLSLLLPDFQKEYPGIAATFDNENRCIPGFIWISNSTTLKPLANFFAEEAPKRLCDMEIIANYRSKHFKEGIDNLPIIMPEYITVHSLESPHHHITNNPHPYFHRAKLFNAIFDAAAIGQFLGGIDPIHPNNEPGFINESCLFNPAFLEYQWILDENGRLTPYANFEGNFYKIINLHIHSKKLYKFKSKH